MKNFKPINLPVFDDLYTCIDDMIRDNLIDISKKQVCLNAPLGKEYDTQIGAGSLYYDWDAVDLDNIDKNNIPVKDIVYEETNFVNLCTVFKDTPLEELYNILNRNYNIGRVRIMSLQPKSCLSWHSDESPRLHYPIKTQEGCLMVIEDEVYHLPQDTWTMTNTTVKHTAINGSFENRLHIVATILDNYEN